LADSDDGAPCYRYTMRTSPVILCGLLAFTACAVDDVGPPASATADVAVAASGGERSALHDLARRGLLAEDGLLAASIASLGEADGLWPWLTDDATYLHPGVDLITGRGAARDFLRQAYPDRRAQTQRLHRESGDVSADAQLGYTFGWFDEDVLAADGSQTTKFGKYIATWRRTAGLWWLAGFVRVPGSRAPSPPPADAGILAGEHGVVRPGRPGELRASVFAADAAFAALSVAQGYTIAFTSYDAADAVVVAGSDFFWNAAGVEFAWSGWTPAETLDWAPLIGAAAASGDLAYTIGTATYRFDDGTAVQTSYSKYLTVWIRHADGSWRFLLDGGNGRPAPGA
jgi:ketosteroid isomerase-like protein